MLSFFASALVGATALLAASQAFADVRVSVKNEYYAIAGKSGMALLEQMDRMGPKHGFLARAIAQTRYSVTWEVEWAQDGSTCRVRDARANLQITFTYPKVGNAMSPGLKKRWARFYAGVRKHEEIHGKIAREMVANAEKTVRGLSTRNDRTCSKSKREVKRRVDDFYDRYEAKQVAFDEAEHRDGGNVERLVSRLMGFKD